MTVRRPAPDRCLPARRDQPITACTAAAASAAAFCEGHAIQHPGHEQACEQVAGAVRCVGDRGHGDAVARVPLHDQDMHLVRRTGGRGADDRIGTKGEQVPRSLRHLRLRRGRHARQHAKLEAVRQHDVGAGHQRVPDRRRHFRET